MAKISPKMASLYIDTAEAKALRLMAIDMVIRFLRPRFKRMMRGIG